MPIGLGAAIVGAGVVGAGASIISGNKAAAATTNAANSSNALQSQIYNSNKQTLAPYVDAGAPATNSMQALLGLAPGGAAAQDAAFSNFRNSSGYNFQLQQGQKSVTAALGNRGMMDSGAAQKSLTNYGQGMAASAFNDYYAKLAGQQGVGLTAASAQAGVGTNYANAVSSNNANAANGVANAALNTGNAVNSALGSSLSAYNFSQGLKSSYGSGGGFAAANDGLGAIY